MSRPTGFRKKRTEFLIICQGEETECNYFNKIKEDFNLRGIQVVVEPKDPKNVVKCAIKRSQNKNKQYNQIWCVFDKDEFTDEDFNSSIKKAELHKIKVAYSNEAFELWFFLHFNYCTSKMNREILKNKVDKIYQKIYDKKYKKNNKDIYHDLKEKTDNAIKNSRKLLKFHNKNTKNYAKLNPSTTVHLLVEELRKLAS